MPPGKIKDTNDVNFSVGNLGLSLKKFKIEGKTDLTQIYEKNVDSPKFYKIIKTIKNDKIRNTIQPNNKTICYQRSCTQATIVGLKVGCKRQQTIKLLILLQSFF